MAFRRMTISELSTLANEVTAFETWRAYASFATDVYGPSAEYVDVSIGSDYFDEGWVSVIEAVSVRNAAQTELPPDLSTDWWQSMLNGERTPYHEEEEESAEDYIADLISERRSKLPVLARDRRFVVSKMPELTYRRVYLEE